MDLLPTEEQSEIISTVRAQLDAGFSLNTLADRDGQAEVIDAVLWNQCAELGWFALGLDEAVGGIGYGLAEEALLFEELGAHCTPGPFLATVMAAHCAALAGSGELVAEITSATKRVALAEPESVDVVVSETAVSGDFRLTDSAGAEYALVLDGERTAIISLAGAAVEPVPSLDLLVPLATASLDTSPIAFATDPSVALRATVLTAAMLSGVARATAEQSTEYAKDREQFGRPVGSFQAVKHRCADMAVRADAAEQLTHLAALAVAGGHDDGRFQAEAARVVAGDAAVANAETNVQNHGGIGFTWEHTAHRYVTRARIWSQQAGDRRSHLRSFLDQPAPA
ncbi:MAG: acyl-CoA dehydrogenase family protein [Microthrixaceae bacterium]